MTPRVSLDARLAGYPGIGRFIVGLWGGLLDLGADLLALTGRKSHESWLGPAELEHPGPSLTLRSRPYLPAEQLELRRVLRRLDVGVHHSPHVVVPYLWRGPTVLTVHDLFLFKDPSKARSLASGRYHRMVVPRAVARATLVVAGCAWAAKELKEMLGVPDEKLRVVDYGIDHGHFRPRSDDEVASVRRRHGLEGPYLLYVGTAKPHKNLASLLRSHRDANDARPLVVAGASNAEVAAVCGDAGLPGRVKVLGRVPDGDLPALYSGADAMLLPSLYESLGFPAIEAMACGTAVVASTGGGLPDTVGDAGLLIDPEDVDGWRQAMERISGDAALREALVERGHQRVEPRSWVAAAQGYLAIYDEVFTRPRRGR